MYFTENRYDRSIEWMMKGVPNDEGCTKLLREKFGNRSDREI